jgi:ABC-2 type transport system permease protein
MNKIWLIIKREFTFRVRKRSFLIVTLLVPLFFAAMIVVPILIATSSAEDQRIAVIDDSHLFLGKLPDEKGIYFKFLEHTAIDTFNTKYGDYGYSGVLYIPPIDIDRPLGITYYSQGQPGIGVESHLNKYLNDRIEEIRMEHAKLDVAQMRSLKSDISIDFKSGKEAKKGSAVIAYAVGYSSGFIIYIILMFFGMAVMRGVMEEKVNRIAEVMISSVKPFQLMMGKIIGIAGVGLLQFLIWAVLIMGLQFLLPLFFSPASVSSMQQGNNAAALAAFEQVQYVMDSIHWGLIIGCFVFYFLGGYLFYSALFAAVGSLVNEDPTDVQSLTFPITLPIIIGIMIMISSVQHPGSTLAVWGSLIPFTSPMVMMARIPYGVPGTVPYWQLGLSMVLLILGFLLTTWMAGKIYRTGILLYGKKITWKEAIKWVGRKG